MKPEVTMRRILAIIGALVLGATAAPAGEIYGTITEGGKPVGEGATVEIRCGETAYPAVKTDKTGSYHLAVKETGKCTLGVQHKGQTASLEVASYQEGVQVDLVLEQKDGKVTLRRK
jgi:hypothetical protein